MSGQVCYVRRFDSGLRLGALRLLGAHADAVWHAHAEADPTASVRDAAAWIRERLSGNGSRAIDTLYLDADGAVCTWVSAPEGDRAAARKAALRDDEQSENEDEWGESTAAASRFPVGEGREVSVEPLVPGEGARSKKHAGPPRRVGVIAASDVTARLLLDELDRLGVRVGTPASVWHAIARAWAPEEAASHAAGPASERVVSEHAPTVGVVVHAPDEGRLHWAWSRKGEPIAAGSSRVPPDAELTPDDLGALTNTWLGWAAQLGMAPDRVVCVGPKGEGVPATASALADWVRQRWPGTTAEAVHVEDPIAATLRRAGERGVGRGMGDLAARHGRAHRAAYLWTAGAQLVLALFLAIIAWQIWSGSSRWSAKAAEYDTAKRDRLSEVNPALATSPFALQELSDAVAEARRRLQPPAVRVAQHPVLEEFETLTMVLGGPDIDVRAISVDAAGVSATVMVDDIASFERLRSALQGIAGSKTDWREPRRQQRGSRLEAQFSGLWNDATENGG